MDVMSEIFEQTGSHSAPPRRNGARGTRAARVTPVLPWLRAQSINVTRHAAALRPFRRDEFGTGAATPTEAHFRRRMP